MGSQIYSKHKLNNSNNLFIIIFFFLIVDLEVSELVNVLTASHHSQPITQVVLLQVLLRQVFQVPLGEVDVGVDNNLVLSAFNCAGRSKIVYFPFHLDAVLQELRKVSQIHDTILNWVGAIQSELLGLDFYLF